MTTQKIHGDNNLFANEETRYFHDETLKGRNEEGFNACPAGKLLQKVYSPLQSAAERENTKGRECKCFYKKVFDDLHKNEIKRVSLKFGKIADCWGNVENGIDFVIWQENGKLKFSLKGTIKFESACEVRIEAYAHQGDKLEKEIEYITMMTKKYGLN